MVFALASRGAAAPGPQAIRRNQKDFAVPGFCLGVPCAEVHGFSPNPVDRKALRKTVCVRGTVCDGDVPSAPEPMHSRARHA